MRYFFLKLGRANARAKGYLGDVKEGGTAQVAVYYGEVSVDDCKAGNAQSRGSDARDFCLAGDTGARENTRIVVISDYKIFILSPAGEVTSGKLITGDDGKPDIEKLMPVNVLVRKPLARIPHLLASMRANAWWIRGTFRSIGEDTARERSWKAWPHQLAIEGLLGTEPLEPFFPPFLLEQPHNLLCCLSSVELETLVAKLFEEAGCFVPAYRGGSMPEVDIIAFNDRAKIISIGGRTLPPGDSLAIQVKGWLTKPPTPNAECLLVSLNLPNKSVDSNGWDSAKLWDVVKSMPKTRAWIRRSLQWLPESLKSMV